MNKRLGTISKHSTVDFVKQNSSFQLLNLKMTGSETFNDPAEPLYKSKLDLQFENSTCEYQKL